MKSNILIVLICCLSFITTTHAQSSWPQKVTSSDGTTITIYQPQSEDINGNTYSGRSAISVITSTNPEPVFGVFWFTALLQNEPNNKTALLRSLTISQIRLPDSAHQYATDLIMQSIQSELPKKNIQFNISDVSSAAKQEKKLKNPVLNNTAPNIIYRTKGSTLVVLDGAPKLQQDKKFNLQRVVNTPSIILKNPDDNLLYFYGGGIWYSAKDINDKWSFVKYLPTQIQRADDIIHQDDKTKQKTDDNDINKPTTPTDIIVSTVPAELIQTEGEVSYQSIAETNLLYADNSLDDIFKDVNTQKTFILVAGRWYSAASLNGPWTYIPSNQLPSDFAKIPEGSEKDGVLSNVAGTDAANQAVMDAQVPQTAKIDRHSTTCKVTYDGDPQFSAINGTNLWVAENSNITVLRTADRYYAVDNGIWFVSNTPDGPWTVSTQRPYDVDNIPANNIAYNTRYVYVYDYNPDYVWAGYTSGYTGNYIYGSTVVWGTGYYYKPWHHHRYFQRPYTWGFGMHYNPWIGWGISYNMWPSMGWGYFDNGYYGGGCWFGPRRYRPAFNRWGYNGGYYGDGGYFMRKPNVSTNRPTYANNNNSEQPHRPVRNNYNGQNTNANLYHHVKGASTVDLFQHPRNGGRGDNIQEQPIGKPHNPNTYTPTQSNPVKQNNNLGQQHYNNNTNHVPQDINNTVPPKQHTNQNQGNNEAPINPRKHYNEQNNNNVPQQSQLQNNHYAPPKIITPPSTPRNNNRTDRENVRPSGGNGEGAKTRRG